MSISISGFSFSSDSGYARIVEMMIESAAIHSITGILYIPFQLLTVFNNEVDLDIFYIESFFTATVVSEGSISVLWISLTRSYVLQSLAPTLIMLRVLLGRAHPDGVWSHTSTRRSSIQFNMPPLSGLGEEGALSTTVTIPGPSGDSESDGVLREKDISSESASHMKRHAQIRTKASV
jgi:hypothetical protein